MSILVPVLRPILRPVMGGIFDPLGGDPTLTLHQEFGLDAGAGLAMAALRGPTQAFTRASVARAWNQARILVQAANDVPRFDHDPVTGAALGFLPEEQQENLCLQSEDFSTTWSTTVTVTTNSTVAPDGNITADTLEDDDGAAVETCQQGITVADDSEDHTFSLYVLKDSDETRFPEFGLVYAGGTGISAFTQLNTKTGATNQRIGEMTLTVVDRGNFWYIHATFSNNGAGNTILFFVIHPAETTTWGASEVAATGSIVAWGAQLVKASSPLSYIKTTTAAVTRSADVDSADISAQLGATNTWLLSGRTGFGAGVLGQIDDGTENERHRVERLANDEIHVIATVGGLEKANLDLGVVADLTDIKVAVTLASGTDAMFASLNGAALVKGSPDSLPSVDTIRYGMDTVGNHWNNTIKGGKLWKVDKPEDFVLSIAA